MTSALAATAAMSVGAVAATLALHPLVAFAAFAVALALLLIPTFVASSDLARGGPARSAQVLDLGASRLGLRARGTVARLLVALAVVAAVADRHLFVSSTGIAPDDALAALVVVGALVLPRGPRWAALGVGVVLATYAVTAATLLAASPYHSDAVVSAHGAAELVLEGRHPYAAFDLIEQLGRFGLPPELSTALEDGTRVRSLQYPAVAFLAPAPLIAAGLDDVRVLYLAEVLVLFGIVIATAPAWARPLAHAACVGNLVVLGQSVLAGADPLWAVLLVVAWLLRRHRISAVVLGLAVADRQQAWLAAPFLVVWAWHNIGPREAVGRGALAAAIALAVHAPFLWTDPRAVIGGLLDSALQPHEPWGVGPSKLLADVGLGSLVPRTAYLAAAGTAYLVALWAYAAGSARGALVLPLLPLWISWRALQSYFAFLPLFAMADEDGYDPSDAGR